MKYFNLVLFVILILGCKEERREVPESITVNIINEIVSTVLLDDSLVNFTSGTKSIYICDELLKLELMNFEIINKSKSGNVIQPPPPPPRTCISVADLLNLDINGNYFFTLEDTAFLKEQGIVSNSFKIDSLNLKDFKFYSKDELLFKSVNGTLLDFYEMTLPIFSKDKCKAYLELNHFCKGLCGGGVGLFLQKHNDKWIVIHRNSTWMS